MRSLISLTLATLALWSFPAMAAVPDQQTFDFVQERYTLKLRLTRGGCTWYANPDTLTVNAEGKRLVSVWEVRGEEGGSNCNGVFQFLVVTADCSSNSISWSYHLGSPAIWQVNTEENSSVANIICSL